MTPLFNGTGVAVTTPFTNNRIDEALFIKHINFLIDNGIDALFIAGTTGEGTTLTNVEKIKLFELAVEVSAGRVQVFANTGTNDTAVSIELTKQATALGVDGIMAITPYYNKTNQRGLIAHFTAIANATNLPVVLYNVPSRTNMTIDPKTIAELANVPNISALKDATGDVQYANAVKALVSKDFKLYSGNDDMMVEYYELGASGLISVVGNVAPRLTSNVYHAFQESYEASINAYDKVASLIEVLSVDINPMPIKSLVEYLGYASEEIRLPLVALRKNDKEALIECLKKLEE